MIFGNTLVGILPAPGRDLEFHPVHGKNMAGVYREPGTIEQNFFALDGMQGSLELRLAVEDREGPENEKSSELKMKTSYMS